METLAFDFPRGRQGRGAPTALGPCRRADLDPSLRTEVRDAVIAAQTLHGSAIVIVTHDLDDAARLGNHIAFMLDRRMEPPGRPTDVFAHPGSLAIARFLGFPNEVPGQLREDGAFQCVLGRFVPGACYAPPGPAIAVFRADAAHIIAEPGIALVLDMRHGPDRVIARVAICDAVIDVAVSPSFSPPADTPARLELDANAISVYPRLRRRTP